ncbi:hypothetical protein VMCG_08711 [Cytospora schulzeri]|uniref:Uncharacterized protein n=1 Tax=Cytospora schulzeri TaxID=448051 RepID=A0A423VQB3_9PEZI|nr:hypothetical protein VMCG_08711 [Valsa malicola]
MGRTLPWKKGESARAVTKTSRSPRPTGNGSRPPDSIPSSSRVAATPPRTVSHLKPARPTSHPKVEHVSSSRAQTPRRSPSSSPSPEPIPESFMIDGFENDDQWRMVEDEFYAVAGHFTAHLHAAQYRRMREEAKKQNSNTIPTISRPVTAPPTNHVKRRQAALALAAAQRQGVKSSMSRINDEETEDEDEEIPCKGTHLAGLMNSPRKKVQSLTNMPSAAGTSHIAALSSPRNGLLSPFTSRVTSSNHRGNPFSTGTTRDRHITNHVIRKGASQSYTASQRARTLDESDDDDDLERLSSRQPSTHRDFLRTQPGTAKTETSRSIQARSASFPIGVTFASKETSIAKPSQASRTSSAAHPPVSEENDSDSGAETFFQRRMRERRGRRKSSRHNSSTPDEPGEKDESQSSQQKSQKSQDAVFIVPSF